MPILTPEQSYRYRLALTNPDQVIGPKAPQVRSGRLGFRRSNVRGEYTGLQLHRGQAGGAVYLNNTSCHTYNDFDHTTTKGMEVTRNRREAGAAGKGLAQTVPGDLLVTGAQHQAKEVQETVAAATDSFDSVGVLVTHDVAIVPSVLRWLKENVPEGLILPHAFSPRLLATLPTEKQRRLFEVGLRNAAAYTKNGFERLMCANGLATPKTWYWQPGSATKDLVAEIYRAIPGDVIINGCSGAGGTAIYIVPRRDLERFLLSNAAGEMLQIQEYFPDLWAAPSINASLSDFGVGPIFASNQRFKETVKHAGNIWNTKLFKTLKRKAPRFPKLVKDCFQTLWEAGVRGPVNIDVLIRDDGSCYLREANVRCSGSQAIARIATDGRIAGESVDKIQINTKVAAASFPATLAVMDRLRKEDPNLALVLLQYNVIQSLALIAFCGNRRLSENDLNEAERDLIARLR